MDANFKKGVVEMCVMKVISSERMYGYQIIDRLSKSLDVNENTIYPILRRLTEQAVLVTIIEPQISAPPRKYYELSNEGKIRLTQLESEWRVFLEQVLGILEGK